MPYSKLKSLTSNCYYTFKNLQIKVYLKHEVYLSLFNRRKTFLRLNQWRSQEFSVDRGRG